MCRRVVLQALSVKGLLDATSTVNDVKPIVTPKEGLAERTFAQKKGSSSGSAR